MTDKVMENNQVTVMGKLSASLPIAMRFSEKDFIWWM